MKEVERSVGAFSEYISMANLFQMYAKSPSVGVFSGRYNHPATSNSIQRIPARYCLIVSSVITAVQGNLAIIFGWFVRMKRTSIDMRSLFGILPLFL